ncbi:MAG: hypothetical protein LBD90_00870 [Bifidobacteriaceae bacterium]|nr:hypothetical protein [Bifidobacteriaceae bacterium]
MPEAAWGALLGCALTAFGLVGAELAARRLGWDEFAARKLMHTAASLTTALGAWWLGQASFIWVGLVFLALMAASRLIPSGALATLAKLRQTSWGETSFPLGVALSAWLAPDLRGFVAAVAVLGAADTAAALAGRRWPRPKLAFGKSPAGSLAFLVLAAAVLMVAEQRPYALAVAAAATAAEALSPRGLDNATIPVTVALALRAPF